MLGNDLKFRFYQYAIVWVRIEMKDFIEFVTDIECLMSFIDESYLLNILFKTTISKMPTSVNVRGIKNAFHECVAFIVLNVFLNETLNSKSVRNQLLREFHIIKNLKCRILIEMNVLEAEQISLNMINKVMIIPICKNLIIDIRIAPKPNVRIKRIVHSKKKTIIPLKTTAKISTYLKKRKLFNDRNYLFEFNVSELTIALKKAENFYIHVCDCNMFYVHVKNDRSTSIIFVCRARLKTLTEYEKKDCYEIENSYHEIALITHENIFYE